MQNNKYKLEAKEVVLKASQDHKSSVCQGNLRKGRKKIY